MNLYFQGSSFRHLQTYKLKRDLREYTKCFSTVTERVEAEAKESDMSLSQYLQTMNVKDFAEYAKKVKQLPVNRGIFLT